MVKTNIQTFSGEVEILSNLHVGPSGSSYLTANGAASNVLDITGNVGATFFVGDGGFLSNIATTLSDIVNQGNVSANVLQFTSASGYAGVGLVTSSNVGIQNTAPSHTLSIGDKIRVNNNTDESAGESVIEVDGRILATRFKGDGGLLSNIATTFESIVNQGNVASNVVKFSSASGYGGVGLVTDSNVGIQNTAPTHNLSIGSNVHVNDTGANVLTIHGNVVASNINMGVFSIVPAYGLNDVCSTSNGTTNVVQFQNGTTSLVASSNITASGNITAQTIISGSNVEIADRLKFTGNVFVDTLRVADVAANIVTYDRTTGELLDSSGTFMNKFAVVSEQPPSDFFANTTTVTNHGSYTLTTSNLATNSNTYNAFDGTANAWTGGTGMYVGGSNVLIETNLTQLSNLHPTQFGDWLAIEFPYKTTLRHMKLTPATVWQSFPYAANLYATNNDLTWTEIKYWDGLNPGSASNVQTITVNATEQFKKYALVTTKLVPNTNIASAVALQDWQLFTESFSIDGGKVAMAQQAATGGETVMDQHGPHGRLPTEVPLKKYPEIAFEEGKFDENGLTLLPIQIQAGYTVSASKASTIYKQQWAVFDGRTGSIQDLRMWRPKDYNGTGPNQYNTSTGLYDPTAITAAGEPVSRLDTNTEQGEWISVEMPKAIKLEHFHLYSQFNSVGNLIESGHLYAKNASTDSWVKIHSFNDVTTTSVDVPTVHNVNSTTPYKYFALIVTKSAGQPTLGEWELYGYEEDPPAGDTSVDTTFTSIMNTPQTTGANVYVDAKLSSDFTNRVVGPTVSNTHTTYVSTEKYWELSGNVESNVTLEANTFLSGDAPHSLSMWFNSSNLEANASNSCIFSLGTEERLDHISAAFSNNYQTVQKFTAGSRSTTNANFGTSCAINSDGTRMIVGAINEDTPQTNYGAVYIYTYSDGKWDNGVRIGAPTPVSGTGDQGFGRDVDINSAGTRVVVGSWYDDTQAVDAGAAWVYSYSNGSWTLDTVSGVSTGRIQASNAGGGDRFGSSVAMSGDGTRITVGAILEDTGVTSAGSAYIYTYSGGSWGSEKIIQASDASTGGNAEFGWKVAMNNDGTKVVVGAAFHDIGGGDIGAAYVFTYNSSGDSWSQQEKIQSSDKVAGDRFGYCVDINSDGTKIVVGADNQDTGGSAAGAAYVYTYNNGSWYDSGNNEQKIQASDKRLNTEFGTSAFFNTDGTRVIIGAKTEDTGATDSGAAYIFAYDGSNWNEVVKLKAPDKEASDHFGNSVAMSGDGKRVVVGAQNDDDSPGSSSGSVYVYDRDTTHHLTTDLKLQSNTWHNLTYAYQGEGGSRVTYLDGRKVAEDQAEDTFGEYPPFAMTGSSQGGYVVDQSAFSGNADGYAYRLFDDSLSSAYQSGLLQYSGGDSTSSAQTTTATDGTTHRGVAITLELPTKIRFSYAKITSHTYYGRTPVQGTFLGSNNNSTWDVIGTFAGLSTTASGQTHIVPITEYASKSAYRYIRLVVTKVHTSAVQNGGTLLEFKELEYYGHRENDLVRLPDPTNVLKYPHVTMTGPAQRGYVASASNYFDLLEQYAAWKAFDAITDDPDGWVSPNLSYESSGTPRLPISHSTGSGGIDNLLGIDATSSGGDTSRNGSWLKIELLHKLKLSQMKLFRRQGVQRIAQGFVYGSNDNLTFYQISNNLSGISNIGTYSNTDPLIIIPTDTTTAYKYFVVQVTAMATHPYANIGNLELYGTGVDSIPIQIGGGNIDKVANFRVYDKFVGEDQALEIWDAQKDEFGRAKSSMTLQKGRLGIGTTEPEGRLAVADEPDPDAYGLQEFPPGVMSGDETHIEGHGEFCASSGTLSTGGAYLAFNKTLFERGWHGGAVTDAYYTNSIYQGTLSNGGYSGDWIRLDLPYKVKLNSSILYSRDDTNYVERMPKKGVILGSNDDGGSWELVHSWDNETYEYFKEKRFVINSDSYFKSFILVIQELMSTTTNNMVNLGEWRLFGYREQVTKQSVLHDGQLTLTKNLTVPRIGPALGEYPTPRRTNLKVEFDTSLAIHGDESGGRPFSTSGQDFAYAYNNDAHYSVVDKAFKFPSGTSTATDNLYGYHGFTLGTSPAHTHSLWVKRTSYGYNAADYQWVAEIGTTAGNGTMSAVLFQASSHRISFDINNTRILSKKVIALNRWYHVVCTFSGVTSVWNTKNCKIYIDGVDDTDLDSTSGTHPFSLGSGSTGTWVTLGGTDYTTRGMTGLISNYKLYDVALTPDEVYTLYKQGKDQQTQHLQLVNTTMTIGPQNRNIDAMLDVAGRIRVGASTTLSFTGQHICSADEPMEKGLIVSAKKNRFVKLNGFATGREAITVDESLPIVSLSNVAQDKACFGVVSSIEKPSSKRKQEINGIISETNKENGDNRAIVNSVGEGAIWVVDTGGSLESGDYITTSNVAGYGQKQNDDVLHNYTVAKITMDCDFTGSNVAVQTIKREETGLRTIMEDTWNQLVDYDRSSNTETQYSNTLAPSAYSGQSGYTPREVTTIVDYTDGSNIVSIAEWSNLESNIQNTYQSNTFTEIVDYTKFVNLSEWSNLTTETQNTYSEAEITTYYQIQRGENVLDENGQLQFEDMTGATEAPYERRFLDVSGAQTDEANAVHIAAFVGCTYHCG